VQLDVSRPQYDTSFQLRSQGESIALYY